MLDVVVCTYYHVVCLCLHYFVSSLSIQNESKMTKHHFNRGAGNTVIIDLLYFTVVFSPHRQIDADVQKTSVKMEPNIMKIPEFQN